MLKQAAEIGLYIRKRIAKGKDRKRVRRLEEQLSDTLKYMAMSVRASLSLRQAMAEAAAGADEPIKTELRQASAELNAGLPLDEVMAGLARRSGSRDFAAVASILSLGAGYGGDFVVSLEALADVVEKKMMLRREAQALTAQARLSAMVLSSLPVGFFVLSPVGGARQALTKPLGWLLVLIGLSLNVAGLYIMRRLAEPERLC